MQNTLGEKLMKIFNCSINKYVEAESEDEAIESFLDDIENLKIKADVQVYEHIQNQIKNSDES